MAEGAFARDSEAGLTKAAEFGGDELQGLELPSHDFGVAAVHLDQVSREEGGLVTAGPRPDLDDHPRAVRSRLFVVNQVAQGFRRLQFIGPERIHLRLGVGAHLGIGFGVEQCLGFGKLLPQLQVTAVRDGNPGQGSSLFRQDGDPGRGRT